MKKQGHQVQKVRSEVELGTDKSWLFFCALMNWINNHLSPLQRINFVLTCSYWAPIGICCISLCIYCRLQHTAASCFVGDGLKWNLFLYEYYTAICINMFISEELQHWQHRMDLAQCLTLVYPEAPDRMWALSLREAHINGDVQAEMLCSFPLEKKISICRLWHLCTCVCVGGSVDGTFSSEA